MTSRVCLIKSAKQLLKLQTQWYVGCIRIQIILIKSVSCKMQIWILKYSTRSVTYTNTDIDIGFFLDTDTYIRFNVT